MAGEFHVFFFVDPLEVPLFEGQHVCFYIFVGYLFNDGFSSWGYITLNDRVIREGWIGQNLEGSDRVVTWGRPTVSTFCYSDWILPWKISVKNIIFNVEVLSRKVGMKTGAVYSFTTFTVACIVFCKYKVVQIWPGQTVTCLHTNSPGHIWTTLYYDVPVTWCAALIITCSSTASCTCRLFVLRSNQTSECWHLFAFSCIFDAWMFFFHSQLVPHEMGRTCGTYGGEERCIQGFSGETWGKETTWRTQT
jgi:hypothetical protein